MISNGDEGLRHGPRGLSMSPGERRGRVRLTVSPAEERRRTKALERKEQMLTEDICIAGALMEMIDAGVLPRDARARPLWHGRTPRAYRHGEGRWRGWPPRVRLRRCGVEGEALCCLCVCPPHPRASSTPDTGPASPPCGTSPAVPPLHVARGPVPDAP